MVNSFLLKKYVSSHESAICINKSVNKLFPENVNLREESKEQMFKWPLDGVSIQAFFAISFQISWLNWF